MSYETFCYGTFSDSEILAVEGYNRVYRKRHTIAALSSPFHKRLCFCLDWRHDRLFQIKRVKIGLP